MTLAVGTTPGPYEVFSTRLGSTESRALGFSTTVLTGMSASDDMALLRNAIPFSAVTPSSQQGTLADQIAFLEFPTAVNLNLRRYPSECGNPYELWLRHGRGVAGEIARDAGPTRRAFGGGRVRGQPVRHDDRARLNAVEQEGTQRRRLRVQDDAQAAPPEARGGLRRSTATTTSVLPAAPRPRFPGLTPPPT